MNLPGFLSKAGLGKKWEVGMADSWSLTGDPVAVVLNLRGVQSPSLLGPPWGVSPHQSSLVGNTELGSPACRPGSGGAWLFLRQTGLMGERMDSSQTPVYSQRGCTLSVWSSWAGCVASVSLTFLMSNGDKSRAYLGLL